jgi:tetratricopeptide (TPR) repeat protein
VLPLLAAALLTASGSGADGHLLAGAKLFRSGEYAEALVEFQVATRLGAPEASAYVGVALVKLGRPEDAIEAFGGLEGEGPDALVEYYRAVAAYDARLYQASDRLLASVGERSGPKIAAHAAKLRSQVAAALADEPSTASVDWYLGRCAEHRRAGRSVLANAFCAEARVLSARRPDRYRNADAVQGATITPAVHR